MNHDELFTFIKSLFPNKELIGLHEPFFGENEKKFLLDCVDSTFVSSVGKFVDQVETKIQDLLQCKFAVAVVNGTSGLQLAIQLMGVKAEDEVLTQSLSFIATSNAIRYNYAHPVYIDVDIDTMGMSPTALKAFLEQNTTTKGGEVFNKQTGRRIKACIPMHTFGLPCRIDEIVSVCKDFNISVIEDAAEAMGSSYKGKHLGTFGDIAVLSFNGNKIITAGGGGAIVTNNKEIAIDAKHLSTTAKKSHPYEYDHDAVGYNFRMPNLNAALLLAQLEKLETFLTNKRTLAQLYAGFFNDNSSIRYVSEIENAKSNYWLNAIQVRDNETKTEILEAAMKDQIMLRPIWKLAFELPMYANCIKDDQKNARTLRSTILNLPSSYRPHA